MKLALILMVGLILVGAKPAAADMAVYPPESGQKVRGSQAVEMVRDAGKRPGTGVAKSKSLLSETGQAQVEAMKRNSKDPAAARLAAERKLMSFDAIKAAQANRNRSELETAFRDFWQSSTRLGGLMWRYVGAAVVLLIVCAVVGPVACSALQSRKRRRDLQRMLNVK